MDANPGMDAMDSALGSAMDAVETGGAAVSEVAVPDAPAPVDAPVEAEPEPEPEQAAPDEVIV
jgi:hypothetical protein